MAIEVPALVVQSDRWLASYAMAVGAATVAAGAAENVDGAMPRAARDVRDGSSGQIIRETLP